MKQKIALVTGGSRGIGSAIVTHFRDMGYHVIAPSRVEMDLSDMKSIETFCSKIDKNIDVVVNNGGINVIATLDKLADDVFDEMLQVNLKAPLKIIQCLENKLGDGNGGHIVNISSIWGFVSKEGRCGYTAAKTAIIGITRTLALELAPKNILVNAVAPGFVNTELTKQNNTPEEISEIEKMIPIGRMAEPLEVAKLVYFLASDDNTFMTGQTILIDGGYTCK